MSSVHPKAWSSDTHSESANFAVYTSVCSALAIDVPEEA